MISESQSRANLRTAATNVRTRLGLSDTPGTWTYAQRTTYNQELALEVLKYPRSFTDSTVATASAVAGKVYSPLEDTSIAWGDFAADVVPKVAFSLAGLAALGLGVIFWATYVRR